MNFELFGTDYYKWVLSSNDKVAFYALCQMILTRNSDHYNNGLLVVNAKMETISYKSGIPYGTLKDSMKQLDYLGVILKLKKCAKNNRYLIGFRTSNDERLYLINHLISKYSDILEKRISKQKSDMKSKQSPVIEKSDYRLDSTYRDHILEYFENPNELLNERISGKTMSELLFGRAKIYRKPLPRNVVLGAMTAP
jgi:hypothetical protein